MFKMGCSMARKILAIDGRNSSAAGAASGSSSEGGENTNPKKSKHKKEVNASSEQPRASGKATSGDELNDFSKLEADPRIPLNVRQIFKITKSWKAIARTMSKTGTAMFLNLFEQNQDLFYLFDRFQHLKGQDLHESMELREHAATVMSTLDQSINSLSDYDNFVTYLHSIGKLHRKVPGFKRAHFWKIEQPFLKAVKQTLDERCNESIEEIYKIAIKLIIETISVGYGDDDDEQTSIPGDAKRPPSSGTGDNGGAGGGLPDSPQRRGDSGGGGAGKNRDKTTTDKANNSSRAGKDNIGNSGNADRRIGRQASDKDELAALASSKSGPSRQLYVALKALLCLLSQQHFQPRSGEPKITSPPTSSFESNSNHKPANNNSNHKQDDDHQQQQQSPLATFREMLKLAMLQVSRETRSSQ